MDNENKWTEFCDDINRSMADIKKSFKEPELTFVDYASSVGIIHKSDANSLNAIKNYALGWVDGDNKEELGNKIEELLDCIRERDSKIVRLKDDTDKNERKWKEWYRKAKKDCEDLCFKLENYTSDKLGILSLFADIMDEVIDKDGFYMEKAKTKIKGMIRSRKRSSFWKVVVDTTLLLVALAVIGVLFVLIGVEKGLCDKEPTALGKWITVGFILALLVGAIFLIIRICSLIKKSKNETQRLQSLLDKMEIHKMTKHEIDRELEKVL